MKNKTLESKTDTRTSPSPYQAERTEPQQTPVLRPDPLGATLAPPGSEATIRAHAAGLTRATASGTLRRLQRQYGNRYVQRVVERVQRQGGAEGFQLDDETAGRINRARGGGQPLDGAVQAQMGEALGHDFSGVRVHTDLEADALNQQLSARAFTTGHDIFFRQDEYNPGSGSGRELIAHELSHVIQQSTGRVGGGGSGMTVRPAGDAFEQDAKCAARVLATEYAATYPHRHPMSAKQTTEDTTSHRSMLTQLRHIDSGNGHTAQRACWEMAPDQVASFTEGVFWHETEPDDPGQVYWRMQSTPDLTESCFFAPVVDYGPDVWRIAEDGLVTQNERDQLAVLHEWVPEWHFLVLYEVVSPVGLSAYWGTTEAQRDANGWVYQGGADQAVFPPGRVATIIAVVPVAEA